MSHKWEYLVKADEAFNPNNYHIVVDGELLYQTDEFQTVQDYVNAGYRLISEAEMSAMEKEYNMSLCNDWIEIDKDRYNYALDVLPPKKWHDGGFFVPEAFTGTIYGFYQEWHGKFYTSLQDIFTPRSEILENLKAFILKSNAK